MAKYAQFFATYHALAQNERIITTITTTHLEMIATFSSQLFLQDRTLALIPTVI